MELATVNKHFREADRTLLKARLHMYGCPCVCHEGIWESRGMAPLITNLGII
jgi:hypothetical protein